MNDLFNRTKYLGYYLKQMDWKSFQKFIEYAKQKTGRGKLDLWKDAILSTYEYNIGLIDYFIFRFYEKDIEERSKWVGTGYKYEFDLKMNPTQTRSVLENKIEFYEAYEPFVKHSVCTIKDLQSSSESSNTVLDNPSEKLVLKDSLGQCGWNVEVIETNKFDRRGLIAYMQQKGFDMVEEFIQQHPKMNGLSPSGINTIRMITMINDQGGVDFLGARARISVNSHVDNLASGNIACSIDLETGKISGKGVYSDITKESVAFHPVTNTELIGFQIPMWDQVLDLTKKAALHRPENRGVGWDIAISVNGPELIEGNHNWCKILWQLPVNTGLKPVLDSYE